jgi:hypothetical protein
MDNHLHSLTGDFMAEQKTDVDKEKFAMMAGEEKTRLIAYKGKVVPLVIPDNWANGKADGEFITTINRDRPEGRRDIMAALNGECIGLDTAINLKITIAGVTLSPAYKVDRDTGEIIRFVRTVLHCTDGKNYEAFSDGILKSLRLKHSMYGEQMFDPPAECYPRRIPTSDSRSMYRLEWVE